MGALFASLWALIVWVTLVASQGIFEGPKGFAVLWPGPIGWLFLAGTTSALFVGECVIVVLLSAQVTAVPDVGFRVRTRLYGVEFIERSQLYRPVIDRGVMGGVLFRVKGLGPSGIMISHADAQMIGRAPFYPSLPIHPRFANRPRLLEKYERRLGR